MRKICWLLTLALPFALAPPVFAQSAPGLTIDVIPSVGPNGYGASWSGYRTNAITALRASLPAVGDPDLDPSGYEVLLASLEPVGMFSTYPASHSWRGVFDPPAPFNNEYGNQLYFGLRIVAGAEEKVKLQDVVYHIWSTDSGSGSPLFDLTYGFGSSNYSTARVGVNVGADGILNTGDDVLITSGSGSVGVDALYLVGVGASFSISTRALAEAKVPFAINLTYGIGSLTGNQTDTASVSIVPEPATVSFFVLASLALLRRRRK